MTPTRASRGRSPPRATRRGALPRRRRRRRTRGGSRPRGCARRRARDLARVARARRRLPPWRPSRATSRRPPTRGNWRSRGVRRARARAWRRGARDEPPSCPRGGRRGRRGASTWTRRGTRSAARPRLGARRSRPPPRAPHHPRWCGVLRRARARVDADRSDAGGDGARAEAPARAMRAASARAGAPGAAEGAISSGAAGTRRRHSLLGGITPRCVGFQGEGEKTGGPSAGSTARQPPRVVERAAKGTWTRSSDADARADDRWDPSHRAPGSSRGKRAGHASDPPSRDVE